MTIKSVALFGSSHSDPEFHDASGRFKPDWCTQIQRYDWTLHLADQFPHITFYNYARGAHGLDYIDLCIKYAIINESYDAYIAEIPSPNRYLIPLNDIRDVEFERIQVTDNYYKLELKSNRIAALASSKKIYGASVYTSNTDVSKIWEETRAGNLQQFQYKTQQDFLPMYEKLVDNFLYWTYKNIKSPVNNCEFDQSGQDFLIEKFGMDECVKNYFCDGSHVNKNGGFEILNNYLLKSEKFKQLLGVI